MKRIVMLLIIFLFVNMEFVFAIEFKINNLIKLDNEISYSITIINEDSQSFYFTRLTEPYYQIKGTTLYIKYYVLEKPRLVMMDFPNVLNDKKINGNYLLEEKVVLRKINSSPFEQLKELDKASLTKISNSLKEIYFVFGYLEEYDDLKILISKYDSSGQREKFYYVTENRKYFQINYML